MKNYSDKDMANLKLLVTLSRCNASIERKIYPKIKEEGLTETQFSVLNLLYHKGQFNIKEIIEKTFSSGGTMTVVVNNLLKEGYIKKERGEKDKRQLLISITSKGIDLLDYILETHVENLKTTFEVLTDTEKLILTELLKKLGKGKEVEKN
jgi:DNA-binding MarR family transcriptional regulator